MFEQIFTKELLEDLYVTKNLAIADIARRLSTTVSTVRKYMKKFDIQFRQRTKDLTGERFGRLVVVRMSARRDNHSKIKWVCICDCGGRAVINAASLTRGLTTSCGCYKHELCQKGGYKNISKSWWKKLIKSAKQRGYVFDITPEYLWDLYEQQDRKCSLSGLSVDFCPDYNRRSEQTASVDRVDSSVGYIPGNVQIVHKVINHMKSYLGNSEFISFCNLVADKNRKDHEDSVNDSSRKILRKM